MPREETAQSPRFQAQRIFRECPYGIISKQRMEILQPSTMLYSRWLFPSSYREEPWGAHVTIFELFKVDDVY